MKCHVCGDDKRCLEIGEITSPPPFTKYGLRFHICMDCLGNLVNLIKTPKTKLEDPKDFDLPFHAKDVVERMDLRRKENKP